MTPKSLAKWCTVALVVGLFLVWGGQAQQSTWQTQVLAEGPDVSGQRVLTPDIAVVDSTVYVSYVDQATETVWLLISTESGVPGSWKKIEVTAPKVPVANTTVAASKEIVCVAWQQLGDVGPEVWQRCAGTVEDLLWLNNPIRFSIEGAIGGLIDYNGGTA